MAKKIIPIAQHMTPSEARPTESEPLAPKSKTAAQKALETATWARTMTKVIISRNNKKPPFWHVINFLGVEKQESAGIIDLLAIRKDHSKASSLPKGDGFEIILVQVKGGKAKSPSTEDVRRMEAVAKNYAAKAVVLSSWKKGSAPEFRTLSNSAWGDPVDPDSIFKGRSTKPKVASKNQTKISRNAGKSVDVSEKRSASAKAAWATRREMAAK
jgi:hypothetical protein